MYGMKEHVLVTGGIPLGYLKGTSSLPRIVRTRVADGAAYLGSEGGAEPDGQ